MGFSDSPSLVVSVTRFSYLGLTGGHQSGGGLNESTGGGRFVGVGGRCRGSSD